MKKITLLAFLLFIGWHANAQFGCGSAVVITNGYTASGITTPGNAGPEDWNDNPVGTSINVLYWDDDVYLFQYTAGEVDEAISMTITSVNSWNSIGIFTECTGNTFSGELAAQGTTGANSTKTVTAAVGAFQTVYIAVGQWGTPDGLNFSVTEFTATPLTSAPNCSTITTPANGATNVVVASNISWAANASATGYFLKIGTISGGDEFLANTDLGNVLTYNPPVDFSYSTQYFVTLTPYNALGQAVACTETTFTTNALPVNNDCVDAIALTVNSDLACGVVTAGTTVGATESMAATPCNGNPDDDVWFSFVATGTAHRVTLSNVVAVQGTSTDMYFQVLSGACGTMTSVLCSDPNTNMVPGLTPGNTYYIRVYTYSANSGATFNICVGTPPPPPANDNCTGAIALTVNSDLACGAVTAGTTLNATQSMAATPCSGNPDDDVWFSFVATGTAHRVSLSNVVAVQGTSTDMYFQVLSGACGAMTSVLCSDPETNMVTGLTPGGTYYIRVYTYGTTSNATFDICVGTPPPPPANDNCADAIALTVNSDLACDVVTAGTTLSATQSMAATPCVGNPDDDVWFSFVATETAHRVSLSNVVAVQGTSTDMYFQVLSGACGATTSVLCSDPNTNNLTGLTLGNTYYIRVYTYGTTSNATFDVCVGTPPPPPVNDLIENAIVLTESTNETCDNAVAGTTISATHSSGHCNATAADVWYTFVPAASGVYNFSRIVVSGTGNGYISLYSGTPGSLTQLNASCTVNNFAQALTAGTTYYVAVSSTTTTPLSFSLCAYLVPAPPVNDLCSNAISLTPGVDFASGAIVGSTAGATTVTGLTYACQTTRVEDVWYSVVVPPSGNIIIETGQVAGSPLLDTVVSVFSGTCGTLTEIGCDDDGGAGNHSIVTLTGRTPGEVLYVGVWRWGSAASGQFQVSAHDAALSSPSFDAANFKAYPNPVKDILNLSYSQDMSNVAVFNLLGQQVLSKTVNATESQIDMSGLSRGTYLVKVTVDSQVKTIKVIKQ